MPDDPGITPERVRVGIVSWNTAALLDRCLAALPAALDGVAAEIVVVDNASADDSVAVARRHAGVTVIANDDNRGYAKGMNQALAGSDAPVLIALNPDTEPPPGSLARLVRRVLAEPSIGVLVPRLTNVDGATQHTVYRFPSLRVAAAVGLLPAATHRGPIGRRFWLEGFADHDHGGDIDWAIGAVHCIRAAALKGDAPYSEKWFMYVEDLELCWRLAHAGWRIVFDPSVTVPHVANAAGAQAWGNDRTARWLDATYEWYADEHGRLAARAWAAVNAAGCAGKLVANKVLVRFGGARAPQRGSLVGLFRQLLPLHVRKLVSGPTAPLTGRSQPA
ncbi:MAG TPA: glycosyltransferase family 2 protein [Acidimicrobiales bacterium]|nr:glycosyltransferase family 2 protein [Acidimicrobiales bacterium]